MSSKPRVLELGDSVATAFAGALLRDVGMDVIRVEFGDRLAQRADDRPAAAVATDRAVVDGWTNAGKKSVAFRTLTGARPYVHGLASLVDVVLEGLEFSDRTAIGAPPLIEAPCPWVAITPHGLAPVPLAGSDLTAVASSAAMWAIGEPHREPLTIPHDYSSVQAGVVGATLAVAAVNEAPCKPQLFDVAISEVVGSYAALNSMLFVWERAGHRAAGSGGAYPYTVLPCRDGSVCLAARTNADWRRILDVLGNPDWSADPRFSDVRVNALENADQLDQLLTRTLSTMSKADLLARASVAGCAIAPVYSVGDLSESSELRLSGALVGADATAPSPPVPVLPWFENAPRRAPWMGEHNAEIVAELTAARSAATPPDLVWADR